MILVSCARPLRPLALPLGLAKLLPRRRVSLLAQSALAIRRYEGKPARSGRKARLGVASYSVERVHQEDLCQALGIDPEAARRRAKYESAGGPRLRQAAQLLDAWAADSQQELDRLVAKATFTVLIGNADAHGKNLSLLHPTPEEIALAPLYDPIPTALWPRLRTAAAMSIGGQVELPDVTIADIVREAKAWRHPEDRAREVVDRTIASLLDAIDDDVIPSDSDVADFVRTRAEALHDAD